MHQKVVMAYVPVIHHGYIDFFQKHNRQLSSLTQNFIFGEEVVAKIDTKLDYLRKEIRSIKPLEALLSIKAILCTSRIGTLTLNECAKISTQTEIILPEEDVSEVLVEMFFNKNKVVYDNVFLRHNRKSVFVNKEIEPDRIVSVFDFDRELMLKAVQEGNRSSDWWRQVGAVAVNSKGKILFANHNRHRPSPHTPYINGDPRNVMHRGEGLELCSSLHAEAGVIANSAISGISLKGAYLYATTFPCPPCAKLIAASGISRLYYYEGYAVLDGLDDLRNSGVEIIKVNL